jgi:hypothetical protein
MDAATQQTLAETLKASLSPDRLGTYLTAAGFATDRALRLYIWNAQIGEAFHLPIQGAEVGLRNCVNAGLVFQFGPRWWESPLFLGKADRQRKKDLDTASARIANRKRQKVMGQMVANLSFGFWVGMLQPRYNPDVWSAHLRTSFPNLPTDRSRYNLAASAKRTADLRNRIWHHEPIFRMNLSEEYRSVMELLSWICPIKAAWLRPHCRVPQLLRQKP